MNKEDMNPMKLIASQETCRCALNEKWVAEFKKQMERAKDNLEEDEKDIHEKLEQLVHSELVVRMQETEMLLANELEKLGFITADGRPNEAFLAEMLSPEDFKAWQSEYYGTELRLIVHHSISGYIHPTIEYIDPVSGEVCAPYKVRHPHLQE